MYCIYFTYIYPQNYPNVSKYAIQDPHTSHVTCQAEQVYEVIAPRDTWRFHDGMVGMVMATLNGNCKVSETTQLSVEL